MRSCLPNDSRRVTPAFRTLATEKVKVTEIQNLLLPEEAQYLIGKAHEEGMHRSPAGLDRHIDPARTSSTAFLSKGKDDVVKCLENRISTVAGNSVENLEPLQVTQYKHKQEYKPHYDYFRNEKKDFNQRSTTVFAYLHSKNLASGECGGATAFPNVMNDDTGTPLRVYPKVGNAVMWSNLNKDGTVNENTLHGGERVVCSDAHKIGLNAWFRVRPWELSGQ